jgi:hypothetical protein
VAIVAPLVPLLRGLTLFLVVLGVLCHPLLSRATVADAEPEKLSKFQQLALNLRQTPRDIRADFAAVAIAETAAMYRVEYARAQAYSGNSSSLAAWARGVEDYAARLAALGTSISPHSSISIQRGMDSHIHLQVRGEVAILSAPRMHQQQMLEERITRHFCSQYPCDSLIEGYSPATDRGIETLPHWTFRLSPVPSCNSGDGLELMFSNDTSLLKKRSVCKQLFGEFARLATALAEQSGKGVELDWQLLAVHPGTAGGKERVFLNDRDSLELSLPACGASPQLLARVMPWLRTKAERQGNHGVMLVVTNTEGLVAALL